MEAVNQKRKSEIDSVRACIWLEDNANMTTDVYVVGNLVMENTYAETRRILPLTVREMLMEMRKLTLNKSMS